MASYQGYFWAAARIWEAYCEGKISMGVRDSMLRALKARWGVR